MGRAGKRSCPHLPIAVGLAFAGISPKDETGKSNYSDLKQLKATLLIAKALQSANSRDATLKSLWGKEDIVQKRWNK
ncbi:MAG: hypothetical protein ACOCXP_01845 [Candidatus Dojkabacteria bacterium]